MTKKKLHEEVLRLCEEHKAPKDLAAALDELTRPKVGGSSDVNDYTCFDGDGNVTHIFCTYHRKWEPVAIEDEDGNVIELFKRDEKSKNGFARECMEGSLSWREATKALNATKNAVMADLLEEKISGADAKELIAKAEAARTERTPRKDGLGEAEKPCGDAV